MGFPFFKPIINEEYINQRVNHINFLLKKHNTPGKQLLIKRLEVRLEEFDLSLEYDTENKASILEQYNKFTKALLLCLEKPKSATFHIEHYLSSIYFPVGKLDVEPPNIVLRGMAISGLSLGLLFLASAIPAFLFNPSLGAIAIAIGITLILPSLFNLCTPNSLDINKKKVEDKELFLAAVQLVTPEPAPENELVHSYSLGHS